MPNTEQLPAISRAEIIEALAPLLRSMPTKGKVQDRMEGYFIALARFSREQIETGVRKFLSGECRDVRTEFVPPPPQMAQIIRGTTEIDVVLTAKTAQLYNYKPPSSSIIERSIRKNDAYDLVRNRVHPDGAIWCPGPLDKPDFGDLYGPDPNWSEARPYPPNEAAPIERPGRRVPSYAIQTMPLLRDFTEPQRDEPEPEESPRIHDYSNDKIEVTPQLLKQLEDHAKDDARFEREYPEEPL